MSNAIKDLLARVIAIVLPDRDQFTSTLSRGKRKWKRPAPTSDQPSSIEHICEDRDLQDGEPPSGERTNPAGRLHDENESEGCILHRTCSPGTLRIPSLLLPGDLLRISMSSIRPFFGLSSGPRAFTKIFRPVVSLIRSMEIRIVIYPDDILLLHEDKDDLPKIFQHVIELLQNLGLTVWPAKCSAFSTQQLVFLGGFSILSG